MLRNFVGLLKDDNNDIIEHRIVINQEDDEDGETEEASWFAIGLSLFCKKSS